MSRFFQLIKSSDDVKEAHRAMSNLFHKKDDDVPLMRVYADVVSDHTKEAYMKRHGVKESRHAVRCLCRLLGKRCSSSRDCISIEGVDHPSLFLKDGKPFSFVYQPYDMGLRDIKSLVDIAEKYNLDVSLTGNSWHFPDWTVMVELRKKHVETGEKSSGTESMVQRKKPTLPPYQCDHCQRIWYGHAHIGKEDAPQESYVPPGATLCLSCWSELDNYLYKHFSDRYELSWGFMNPEDIPFIHDQARKWIADASLKPLRPKDLYRGGGIPKWLRLALEQGKVKPNSSTVYTITLQDGEPVNVEESQDRSVLQSSWHRSRRS